MVDFPGGVFQVGAWLYVVVTFAHEDFDSVTAAVVEANRVTATPTPKPTEPPTAEPTEEPEDPELTTAQRNAIDKALDYLNYTSFSRISLIRQLEFEGFKRADAKFAVDSLDVDWREQAYLKAVDYLDYTSFSLKGLINQLEFEGFTAKRAKYGATKAYNE
jgi:hypothetical protein